MCGSTSHVLKLLLCQFNSANKNCKRFFTQTASIVCNKNIKFFTKMLTHRHNNSIIKSMSSLAYTEHAG